MIKLIASDVDGTLVKDSSTEIYPEIIPVIRDLREKGVIFAIASGRQYNSIANMFREIKDDLIFIAENGAHIRCRDTDMSVIKMNRPDAEELIRDLRKYKDCDFVVSAPGISYMESTNPEFQDLIINGYHNNVKIVSDAAKITEDIIKIAVYRKKSIRDIGESVLIPKWKDKVHCCMAGEEWVDFIDSKVDKGNALGTVMDFFHILPEETMAFGDNGNDIGMLERADESYAVDTATEEVKVHARHVCGSWRTKGVLNVLKELRKTC